jgi:hypothetical protein
MHSHAAEKHTVRAGGGPAQPHTPCVSAPRCGNVSIHRASAASGRIRAMTKNVSKLNTRAADVGPFNCIGNSRVSNQRHFYWQLGARHSTRGINALICGASTHQKMFHF